MNENKGFDFQKFIEDSKNTLLNPKEQFAKLETQGGLVEPLIKAAIYGAIGGFFTMLWSFLHLGGALGGVFGGAVGVSAFFFSIIGAVVGAFIGGIIILVLSSICSGNSEFEANLRVAVALMVIFPITSFLHVLGGVNYWLNALVGLGVNLYSLYMLYWGLTLTLKGKEQSAKIIGFVLGGLLVLFLIIGLATRAVVGTFSKYGSSRFEKELEKYQKEAEKMAAQYEDEMANMESNEDEEATENTNANPRPEEFPQKAFDHTKDWFAKGTPVITNDKLDRLIQATTELKGMDKSQTAESLKLIQTYGFKDIEDYTKSYIAVVSAMEGVKTLQGMQTMMEASDGEKKAAEMFTLDKAFEAALKQTIAGPALTQADIKFAYDNWDKLNELVELGKKK
jgi:hypothetical protein